MDHLDEVAGAVRTAMQIAHFGLAERTGSTRRPRRGFHTGSQRTEDRVEMLNDRILAADHVAVAAFKPPHAATDTDIDVVDLLCLQFTGAADVVVVVRIAAFDNDVVRLQQRHQRVQHGIHRRRRQHQPHGARLGQCLDEVRQAAGALGTLRRQIPARRPHVRHRRRRCGRPSSGAQPYWRPCGRGRSCRVASLVSLYCALADMVCLAAVTTPSTVKPKCSATTLIGADMPNVCMPRMTPRSPA